MTVAPPRWTPEQLTADLTQATEDFRQSRMREPLEQYLELFEDYRDAFDELLEQTVDLTRLSDQAMAVLSNPKFLEALRYLSGPPISTDDLKTLVGSSINMRRLQADPDLAKRIIDTLLLGLDRRRFPWVSEDREASAEERASAVLASAALLASSRLMTQRRNIGKAAQEQRVMDTLAARGYRLAERRTVRTLDDAPAPGEFCGECVLGGQAHDGGRRGQKADIILRLWDRRVMPIECKVSNSSTNSVKRLNREAAAKAEAWRRDFGELQVVPAAVLGGVYKLHNLQDAQERGLTLFWAHNLAALVDWVETTRP